jgi:riboflavin synthase
MFTGLIEEVGTVTRIIPEGAGRRIVVRAPQVAKQLKLGDSIAVSGVCLTAVDVTPESFAADLAEETWRRTSFSRLGSGARVNLELPMRADGRFGGHIVQGHVDGTGSLLALERVHRDANDYWLELEIPPQIARYVVEKGSLSIEGISLTVARVELNRVSLAIIPHTLANTNLQSLKPGDPLNLEVDLIAKYVERMMGNDSASSSLTLERLVGAGF